MSSRTSGRSGAWRKAGSSPSSPMRSPGPGPGLTTRQYKQLKGLKKENLRDNMSDLELVLNMLAEASTTSISRSERPQGLEENRRVAPAGRSHCRQRRKELEQETGAPVVTAENAQTLQQLVTGAVESAAELAEKKRSKPCF